MSIKSQLLGLLRKLNLLSAAERARFYLQKIKYRKENIAFRKENPDFVLPPEFFIYETYRLNYRWYYEDGKNTAGEIVTLFSKHFNLLDSGTRILDWGCGPGRIVRHLPSLLPNSKVYGTDYNNDYINWCKKNLNGINFSFNKIDPPMHFEGSFFNVVIGLSIFTHLSERNHFDWISELHRVVKFGGGILITTQGGAYYPKLTDSEKRLFDSDQLVTRSYFDEGNRLYSSFQPEEFMKKLFSNKFEVVEYIKGMIENGEPSQDSWLLRKM